MRKYTPIICLFILSVSLSGCGLIEDSFKAGIIFALIIVAIIGLIVWLARMIAKTIIKKYGLSLGDDEEVIERTDEPVLIPQRIRIRNKV